MIPASKRFLAHHVVVDGVDYGMAVATISPCGRHLTIEPFKDETWGTVFVNGYLYIDKNDDNIYKISISEKFHT